MSAIPFRREIAEAIAEILSDNVLPLGQAVIAERELILRLRSRNSRFTRGLVFVAIDKLVREGSLRVGKGEVWLEDGKPTPPDARPTFQTLRSTSLLWRYLTDEIDDDDNPPIGDGDLTPKEYLTSWLEILDALDQKNHEETRAKVRKLSNDYEGPINFPGRGKQPSVEKTSLLRWWNTLESRWNASVQKQQDRDATVQNQYSYGKDGTVVPDLAGHVKKKRRPKRS